MERLSGAGDATFSHIPRDYSSSVSILGDDYHEYVTLALGAVSAASALIGQRVDEDWDQPLELR